MAEAKEKTAWRELLHKHGLLPVADILEKYGVASDIDVSELLHAGTRHIYEFVQHSHLQDGFSLTEVVWRNHWQASTARWEN